MSLTKGSFKAMGVLPVPEAYVVVDEIHITQKADGPVPAMGHCHVSIYVNAPKDQEVDQEAIIDGIKQIVKVKTRERGPVVEHYSISGIVFSNQDPFVSCYQQIRELSDRLVGMADA